MNGRVGFLLGSTTPTPEWAFDARVDTLYGMDDCCHKTVRVDRMPGQASGDDAMETEYEYRPSASSKDSTTGALSSTIHF